MSSAGFGNVQKGKPTGGTERPGMPTDAVVGVSDGRFALSAALEFPKVQ